MTGSRGTWIRRDRRLALDRKFRRAPVYLPLWAEQVWCIAADEGERDGDDVLVPADAVQPSAVLDDLPDAWSDEMAAECDALMRERGMIQEAGDGLVRVAKVGLYNADRFKRRQRERDRRASAKSGLNGKKRAGTCRSRAGHVSEEQEQEQEETLRVSLPATPEATQRAESSSAPAAGGYGSGSGGAEPTPPARRRCPNCGKDGAVRHIADSTQRSCVRHGWPVEVADLDVCEACGARSRPSSLRTVPCQECTR